IPLVTKHARSASALILVNADSPHAPPRPDRVLSRVDLLFDDALLDRLLQLLERAHLDLAHALAADAELLREVLERERLLAQAALGEDVTFALGEALHRLFQEL